MAFLYRVTNSKIKLHLKSFYLQSHSNINNSSIRNPNLRNTLDFIPNPRFYAAPVQANKSNKREDKDSTGPRLNQQITAQFVRLVSDEGHRVVSLREAQELAKSLNLDLVEVSQKANPPVCKIMDYHKEKYKQQLKESAKNKSELTLKKGDSKEVRFVGKIEQKDLKIKADTVKRMMERGYRVKCTAMSMGSDGEDLGAVLARFSPLIEDVAYVESGPRVEKKQAYIVVRHVKFGPSKKGSGKKALKESKIAGSDEDADFSPSVESQSSFQLNQHSDTAESSEDMDDFRSDWSVSGENGNPDEVFNSVEGEKVGFNAQVSANISSDFARMRFTPHSSQTGEAVPSSGGQSFSRRDSGNSLQPAAGEENRYRRDPRNTSLPTKSVPSSSPSSRSAMTGDTSSDMGRQLPLDRSTMSHGRDLGSPFLRKSPPNGSPEQHSSHSNVRPPSSGYGIFSSPQTDNAPSKENNVPTENRYKRSDQFNSGRNSNALGPRGLPMSNAQARRPDLDRRDGPGKYRIFGESSSNVVRNHNSEYQAK